ncbi:sugar porter family MFS transporter [Methanoculleus chikugoensis]|uniref:MFS transporter n=1 Tax=Methanoculleus chikugoensis TaxID=118126 RepID=A0ABN5XIB7_9EURY|nr:sugar porter family MFS transporter [Methanoculleus chikugoensis]BBL68487.1 MFS transporter [Methanoculleus chikugoensis]
MSARGGEPKRSGLTTFVYVAVAVAAVGGFLFGYDTGVISGAILFITGEFALPPTLEEIATSSVLVGAILGAIAGGLLADRIGRRLSIIAASVVFLAGTGVVVVAPGLPVFLAGRVLIGMAIGIASFVVPLYISEIAPSALRGGMVSLNQLFITIGILISYGVDYLFSASSDWRAMFAFGAVPATVLLVGMFLLPDSPRWLVSRQQTDRATAVLRKVRGTGEISGELEEITKSNGVQKAGRWSDLLAPSIRMPLFVGFGLAVLQQLTGINTVIYYAPTIFQFAGLHSAGASIAATAGVGAVNVLATVAAVVLVDRTGRRPLLLAGIAGMVVSLAVLGAGFALSGAVQSGSLLGLITAVSLMAYVASFAIGLGPVFWLLIAEIYPLNVRGRAMSVATVANWGANFLITLTFLTLVGILEQAGVFWLYALVGLLAWFFVLRLVPETKGLTLEEIEEHFRAGRHPRELKGAPGPRG